MTTPETTKTTATPRPRNRASVRLLGDLAYPNSRRQSRMQIVDELRKVRGHLSSLVAENICLREAVAKYEDFIRQAIARARAAKAARALVSGAD